MKIKDNEKLVLKRLKKLAKEIKEHNNFYHNLNKPKISDGEYDKLFRENNNLEKKYPHLILN